MHIIEYLIKHQEKAKTVDELWQVFEDMLVKQKAHPAQIAGMKLAFHAGTAGSLVLLKREILSAKCEEAAQIKIDEVEEQLINFVNKTDRTKQ